MYAGFAFDWYLPVALVFVVVVVVVVLGGSTFHN